MTTTLNPLESILEKRELLHYYRCSDCLAAGMFDGKRDDIACDCGGKWEWQGQVNNGRAWITKSEIPCDTRCTDAAGHNCECSCGGVNHGTHKVITVTLDNGKAIAKSPNPEFAQQVREARDKALNSFRPRIVSLFASVRDRVWISPGQFDDYLRAQQLARAVRHAAKLKIHSVRMKKLAKLQSEIEAFE